VIRKYNSREENHKRGGRFESRLFWSFLSIDSSLLAHCGQDDDVGVLLIGTEELLNLVTNFTIWHLDIILGSTIVGHEGEEVIIGDVEQLIFATSDVGDIHVVGGWGQIFQLLAGEDIESDHVDLGVTVLSSLGGGHVDDLAWATLDDDETVLSQGGTLHGIGGRGTGIGGLEGVLMLSVVRGVRHDDRFRRCR